MGTSQEKYVVTHEKEAVESGCGMTTEKRDKIQDLVIDWTLGKREMRKSRMNRFVLFCLKNEILVFTKVF